MAMAGLDRPKLEPPCMAYGGFMETPGFVLQVGGRCG